MRVGGRLILTRFGGNSIEKLPLSATRFDSGRSPGVPGREHFVEPLSQVAHPFDPASEIGMGPQRL